MAAGHQRAFDAFFLQRGPVFVIGGFVHQRAVGRLDADVARHGIDLAVVAATAIGGAAHIAIPIDKKSFRGAHGHAPSVAARKRPPGLRGEPHWNGSEFPDGFARVTGRPCAGRCFKPESRSLMNQKLKPVTGAADIVTLIYKITVHDGCNFLDSILFSYSRKSEILD